MEKVVGRPRHAFIPFSIGKRQCMAQEVTFMMLRVLLFEIYKRYRLRLAPGATVVKNTVVTTKPAAVPIVRVPRERRRAHGRCRSRCAREPSSRRRRSRGVGRADGDPGNERLPPSRDRLRQQFRRLQGAGRAVRRAQPLLRLHKRRDDAERARRVTAAYGAMAARRHDVDVHVESTVERDRVQVVAGAGRTRRGHVAELHATSSGASGTVSGTHSSRFRATCMRSCRSSVPRRSPTSRTAMSARRCGIACIPNGTTVCGPRCSSCPMRGPPKQRQRALLRRAPPPVRSRAPTPTLR